MVPCKLLIDWGVSLYTWSGCWASHTQGIPGLLRGLIWNHLSGAHADPQLKESYRLLVMKVMTAAGMDPHIQHTYAHIHVCACIHLMVGVVVCVCVFRKW